jgi:hypothetical protein
LARGSPARRCLTEQRGLLELITLAARAADAVREGPSDSAWFAHRNNGGVLTGIEMGGSNYCNFSVTDGKARFPLAGGPGPLPRVAVCEAAIERCRPDTLHAATAGGTRPATVATLQRLLSGLTADPAGILIAATDADIACGVTPSVPRAWRWRHGCGSARSFRPTS